MSYLLFIKKGIIALLHFFCHLDASPFMSCYRLQISCAETESGTLESNAGKCLFRKCMTFLFVLVAHCLDLPLGILYIRDIVINGFIANELISIVENTGRMACLF
ncbi:MAG: phage holin family protein [Lacrimispora sphenoides]